MPSAAAEGEKVEEARQAFLAQSMAYQAAQAATLRLNLALEAMGTAGAAIIGQIRATARVSGVGVLSLALIPGRAKPSPIGAPGTPYALVAELQPNGALSLRWKCDQPHGSVGTMYHVSRQLGGTGEFQFLGHTGKKRFVDRTIPAGTANVVYQIQAVRSTKTGDAAQFPVSLGVSPEMARLLAQMHKPRTSGAAAA